MHDSGENCLVGESHRQRFEKLFWLPEWDFIILGAKNIHILPQVWK